MIRRLHLSLILDTGLCGGGRAEVRAGSGRELAVTRALFRAYGSCSPSEPLEEAGRLGLFGAA